MIFQEHFILPIKILAMSLHFSDILKKIDEKSSFNSLLFLFFCFITWDITTMGLAKKSLSLTSKIKLA